MSERIKSLVKNTIATLIILGLAHYLWKHWDIFCGALDVSLAHILGLVSCILLSWVVNCYQVLLLLRKVGLKVGFWENMVVLIAMIAN